MTAPAFSTLVPRNWKEFELIDAGDGEKLERWGEYILRRPDPVAIWPKSKSEPRWNKAHGHYLRSKTGGGSWQFNSRLPEKWSLPCGELKFQVRPTGFKHTGLFPEQAANWEWIMQKIRGAGRPTQVLNLFAYTGGASVAAAAAGAGVCHVDAAKNIVSWAKENMELSGLGDRPVRWIVDDVMKYLAREARRDRRYDAIIMDPPSFGHGPDGEVWKLEERLGELLEACMAVLTDKPLFMLVNSYTTGLSPLVLSNLMDVVVRPKLNGKVVTGEIGLAATSRPIILPCGIYGRWEA